MTPERWQRVKELVERFADEPAHALEEALDAACADDPAVRGEVMRLLRQRYTSGEEPTEVSGCAAGSAAGSAAGDAPVGGEIGPYRLLSIVGEGGFGVVWLAEQTEPVRRRVALKVIKPGMGSAAVVSRFEAERQTLALMDHPYVARVFDAGVTGPESGQPGLPYFVMELVRGEPITAFCERERLGVEERLKLFIKVCEAVQHAHTKAVIHRDLKPRRQTDRVAPNRSPSLNWWPWRAASAW